MGPKAVVGACRALISLIRDTGIQKPECLEWFRKVHEYTRLHFPDPEFGEWYGYLNRRGEILLDLKGGNGKAVSIFREDCTRYGKHLKS